jgi:hypothetical protein
MIIPLALSFCPCICERYEPVRSDLHILSIYVRVHLNIEEGVNELRDQTHVMGKDTIEKWMLSLYEHDPRLRLSS